MDTLSGVWNSFLYRHSSGSDEYFYMDFQWSATFSIWTLSVE